MFSNRIRYTTLQTLILCLLIGLLAGCGSSSTVSPVEAPSPAPGHATATAQAATAAASATSAPTLTPSATPEPPALRVNGEGVSLAEFEADLSQLQEAQQALGKTADPEAQRQQVLDNFIEMLLLAQGAAESGYSVDDAALQAAIDRLAGQLGSPQALQDWMASRGYTEAAFRAALRRQLAAAWQRDAIAGSVPAEAEQVHARQILTLDENIAKEALALVQIPGTNFAAYAYRYDLQTGGDLGWFPRGYLTQPQVEEAAFALQPGEFSEIIQSEVGYHIVQVIAREPSRGISPDARRVLQHKALRSWLQARREAAQIEILLP